ncbi:MAG: ABC transporter substrate-binding protein, partial [Pseudomonadota bacterium]
MNIVAPFAFARKLFRPFVFSTALLAMTACDVGIGGAPLINSRAAVTVALLVPQSDLETGAVLASSLENAARLAISDLDGVEIELRVYDTGGSATGAANAATAAVQDGARVILGPVFAEAANAAGGAVANRGVNVLAFSNNPAIAGGNVFILGNTFQNAANRLMTYANGAGRNNVYVVHAANAAEVSARDAVQGAL